MSEQSALFEASAGVYDLIYSSKDSRSEVEWVITQLTKCGLPAGGSLLEIGSGTGRHARMLAESGYLVTGVEPSQEMLANAIQNPNIRFIQGDGRSFRLNETFDGVLALFHVLSYQAQLEDVNNFFESASVHLSRGGLFAFDIWFSPAVLAIKPEERVLEIKTAELELKRSAVPVENVLHSLVDVNYHYQIHQPTIGATKEFSEIHRMRHFTLTEIELLAQKHSFDVINVSEFLTGKTPGRDTWGVWFVLGKI